MSFKRGAEEFKSNLRNDEVIKSIGGKDEEDLLKDQVLIRLARELSDLLKVVYLVDFVRYLDDKGGTFGSVSFVVKEGIGLSNY